MKPENKTSKAERELIFKMLGRTAAVQTVVTGHRYRVSQLFACMSIVTLMINEIGFVAQDNGASEPSVLELQDTARDRAYDLISIIAGNDSDRLTPDELKSIDAHVSKYVQEINNTHDMRLN